MTTQHYEARTSMPSHVEERIYVRPERYESTLQRLRANAMPLVAGVLRFQANPFQKGTFGRLTRIRGRLRLNTPGTLSIGERVAFWGKPVAVSVHVANGASLHIGDRVFLNYGVDIGCYHHITIGNDVLIGPLTNVLDDPLHELQPEMPHSEPTPKATMFPTHIMRLNQNSVRMRPTAINAKPSKNIAAFRRP